jgi:hypothetical protein
VQFVFRINGLRLSGRADYRCAKLSTYYKLTKEMRTFKFTLNNRFTCAVAVRLENFGSFTFLVWLPVAVAKMGKCQNVRLGAWVWQCLIITLNFNFCRQRVSGNDLQASDGRDTEALNCKPITNL